MGNKARAPKQALRMKHTGLILKPTQNACIKQESLTKPRSESRLSMTKGEKLQVNKHSSPEATTKGYSLIFQRDKTNRDPDSEDPSLLKKTKHKPQAPHVSAEDLKSLVCLTQAQLQEILKIVKEGKSISDTHEEQEEIGKTSAIGCVCFLETEQESIIYLHIVEMLHFVGWSQTKYHLPLWM